jgi:hypothetical protein
LKLKKKQMSASEVSENAKLMEAIVAHIGQIEKLGYSYAESAKIMLQYIERCGAEEDQLGHEANKWHIYAVTANLPDIVVDHQFDGKKEAELFLGEACVALRGIVELEYALYEKIKERSVPISECIMQTLSRDDHESNMSWNIDELPSERIHDIPLKITEIAIHDSSLFFTKREGFVHIGMHKTYQPCLDGVIHGFRCNTLKSGDFSTGKLDISNADFNRHIKVFMAELHRRINKFNADAQR